MTATLRRARKARYDVASAISQGQRDYQEDALVTDFPIGADMGFVVLADGMGGHAAGDVASKIVVTEVFSELKFQSGKPTEMAKNLPQILRDAALSANQCVRSHMAANPETSGMGATLIAPVFMGRSLFWISVGDSPLYLLRDGAMTQLNEDHSLAPQIDYMAKAGLMDAEEAATHPDRNCLTSVLFGEPIPKIDCPDKPFELRDGDILIASSDGLQYLDDATILEIVGRKADKGCAAIAEALLERIEALEDPEQDNVSFSVVRVSLSDNAAAYEDARATGHAPVSSPDGSRATRSPFTWAWKGDAVEAAAPRRAATGGAP